MPKYYYTINNGKPSKDFDLLEDATDQCISCVLNGGRGWKHGRVFKKNPLFLSFIKDKQVAGFITI